MLNLKHHRMFNKIPLEEMERLVNRVGGLFHIEDGTRNIPHGLIEEYCRILDITPNDIFNWDSTSKHSTPLYKPTLVDKHCIDFVDTNEFVYDYKKSDFAFVAWNNHMTPRIDRGDILFIKRIKKARDMDVVLVKIDGFYHVKKYRKVNGYESLSVISHRMNKIQFTNDMEIVGRVVSSVAIWR